MSVYKTIHVNFKIGGIPTIDIVVDLANFIEKNDLGTFVQVFKDNENNCMALIIKVNTGLSYPINEQSLQKTMIKIDSISFNADNKKWQFK